MSSLTWQASLIKLFWNISWGIWNFRNGVEYSQDSGTNKDQEKNLQQQIKIQWRLGAPAPFKKMLFNEPLYQVLSQPTTTQQVWLHRIKAAKAAFN